MRSVFSAAVVAILLMTVRIQAQAQLTVSFDQPDQTLGIGEKITFTGIITNVGSEPCILDWSSMGWATPLVPDTSPYDAALWRLTIPAGGVWTGGFVDFTIDPALQWGYDPLIPCHYTIGWDTPTHQYGDVRVPFTVTVVPEPSSVLVLGSGILALAGMIRRRNR